MTEINLDDIIRKHYSGLAEKQVKECMLEFGKLLLELAADNAELDETSHGEGGYITTYKLSRDSITSVINQVKQ